MPDCPVPLMLSTFSILLSGASSVALCLSIRSNEVSRSDDALSANKRNLRVGSLLYVPPPVTLLIYNEQALRQI